MALTYTPPPLVTCPACGRERLENGRKAVVLSWRTDYIAKLHCRGCGERWRCPVRQPA